MTRLIMSDRHGLRLAAATLTAVLLMSACRQSDPESAAEVPTPAVASAAGLPNKAKPLPKADGRFTAAVRSEEHTSELQSH